MMFIRHKKIVWGSLLAVLLIVGVAWFVYAPSNTEQLQQSDITNIPVTIDGETYNLHDGYAAMQIVPGSASMNELRLFGSPTMGDISGEGKDDAVIYAVLTTGGTGVFYYALVYQGTDTGYQYFGNVFLGDRIAPQTIDYAGDRMAVNYAVRNEDEAFSVQPSLGKTTYIRIMGSTIVSQ